MKMQMQHLARGWKSYRKLHLPEYLGTQLNIMGYCTFLRRFREFVSGSRSQEIINPISLDIGLFEFKLTSYIVTLDYLQVNALSE